MKLTKQECIKALNVLKEQHDYLSFMLHSNYPYSIEMIKTVQSCFEQLINEHFKLQNDFEMVCKLHDSILNDFNTQKKRMKQLEQENGKLKKQVHSYYMAMVTGKGE